MGISSKMDDLGVPLFQETSIDQNPLWESLLITLW